MRRLNLFRLFESIQARNRDGKEKNDLWVKVRKRLNQLVSFFQQDSNLQLSQHKKLAQSVWLTLISLSGGAEGHWWVSYITQIRNRCRDTALAGQLTSSWTLPDSSAYPVIVSTTTKPRAQIFYFIYCGEWWLLSCLMVFFGFTWSPGSSLKITLLWFDQSLYFVHVSASLFFSETFSQFLLPAKKYQRSFYK